MDCTSLADYGAIGDCRTVALVSRLGSIDWWCTPDFSSPSCFAALLDRERGGCFAITPRQLRHASQRYLPHTNVLCTRLHCATGTLELTDCMTLPEAGGAGADACAPQEIVRQLHCLEGTVEVDVLLDPRPDYARRRVAFSALGPGQWRCTASGFAAQLSTTLALQCSGDAACLRAQLQLSAGQTHFALWHAAPGAATTPDDVREDALGRLAATEAWWRSWCALCTCQGPYAETLRRSALALKLLTHRPTGAVVAAPTTSLPESRSGERNWDYRFCWLRDSSLVLHALTDLGYVAEGRAFTRWLLRASCITRPRLQALYGLHGETELPEAVLPHLRGYHGIGPVRVGNAAARQLQHDAYGEVVLTSCDNLALGGPLDAEGRALLVDLVQQVCEIWREPDHGLWEIRLPPRHNTHSKLMCWAALDRALVLHRRHGLSIDAHRVAAEREAVRADIEARAWSERAHSYVGHYGSDAPDSSVLLMPRLGFIDARHPRMRSTLAHVQRRLGADGLLYRYADAEHYDGVPGPEHVFVIASFWCVDCLARQGRLDEAQAMYERLMQLRNPVGLLAEEYRLDDRQPAGNFPQAFSHVGAITAALSLTRALQGQPGVRW